MSTWLAAGTGPCTAGTLSIRCGEALPREWRLKPLSHREKEELLTAPDR